MSRDVQRAVLLLNVGSPEAPRPPEVRRYLAQFLSDPRVLDMPWLSRQLLLRAVILPFRPKKSAAAYQLVWTPQGSPLLTLSRAQAEALQARLGLPVHLAMRYGEPSIQSVLDAIARDQVEELIVVPLYPQYSSAATGSALAAVFEALSRQPFVPAIQVLRPFWDDPGVIEAYAARVEETLQGKPVDRLICSFHGLPERQVRATDPSAGCLASADCCECPGPRLVSCYRAQCYATASALGARLGLPVSVGFQSRLGRTPWIQPWSDQLYASLPAEGVKRVAVVCPSFVTDCLETLEEVALRGREQFLAAGGESFTFVPCPNDHPLFIDALTRLVRGKIGDAT